MSNPAEWPSGLSAVDASDLASMMATSPRRETPLVLRGAASSWPALSRWTFEELARRGAGLPIRLVRGNREQNPTRFESDTFGAYVRQVERGEATGYLKEFDLLKAWPDLQADLALRALLPGSSAISSSAWIGPRGAHTGLHADLLDNLAVVVRGLKRFYLARPGAVETLSRNLPRPKHDRWARLAPLGIQDLLRNAHALEPASLFMADLQAGDALYVPHGWWHEVVNLQPSILLSGFFGTRVRMNGLWLLTGLHQGLHHLAFMRPRHCTCHPGAAPSAG